MGKQKKVLFLTNSEYGQANVILSVAYEMMQSHQYSVHIASFAPLENRVKKLNKQIPDNHYPITFHTVKGLSALEALTSKDEFIGPFPPGVRGALKTYRISLPVMATAWDGPAYMEGYESCLRIIESVQADVIVMDPLFSQGFEACNTLSLSCVVLCPNTFQEICRREQRELFYTCRYPAPCSGYPYPVPWFLVLANLFLKFMSILLIVTSPIIRAMIKFRRLQRLPALPPVFNHYHKTNEYLVPSTPEIDYPCYVPSNVTGCGPILLPTAPLALEDPTLQSWLDQAPTILINLGTHVRMNDSMARELASGLKTALIRYPSLQVLWKLKTTGGMSIPSESQSGSGFDGEGIDAKSLSALASEMSSGRVRIVEWLTANPLAILQSKQIICFVHHGGSNSFHEAVDAGVPQIVLPCWLDTLEFAHRVEWLGIGVYGSPSATPSVDAQEFSQSLLKVLDNGEEATRMRQRAEQLSAISRKAGGRKTAVRKIIEVLERS